MATEYEIKLTGDISSALHDARLALKWHTLPMKTVYYDTAARSLSAAKRMLRLRLEGETAVVCLKAPHSDAHTRCEWEVASETLDDAALRALVRLGAPNDLPPAQALRPLCAAEFTRRTARLHFPDGSCAELAHDVGVLLGGEAQLPFAELELELKAGAPQAMRAFAEELCALYALCEEPLSKFARAKALADT